MKRIIAVMLAVVLVISGLGSLAYAQEAVNEVQARFETRWEYWLFSGDTFTNGEVTGYKQWNAEMWNELPVTALALTVDSELEFDLFEGEYPVAMGPPTYKWSFGDVAEGDFVRVGVSLMGDWIDYPFPVTYTPGFDASRSADKTEFTSPDTQTITVTVTPRQEGMQDLAMKVWADEDDLVNPVIISPTTDDEQGIWLDPDGRYLHIELRDLELGTAWTTTVTIQVTPKVPKVEFMPGVGVEWREHLTSGTTSESSVTYPVGDPADEVGTWTWSADGSYEWQWKEVLVREMGFEGYSRANEVGADFTTNWNYRTSGDTFENHEVTGEKHWYTWLNNRPDDTEELVYEPNLTLDSDLIFDWVSEDGLIGTEPYQWSFDNIPDGEGEDAGMGFESPSPYTVTFTPGFDAYRSADITEFLQSDGMQVQTVTVAVTPMVTPQEKVQGLGVCVDAWEDNFVNLVITSATTDGPNVHLDLDEHQVWIDVHDDEGIATCTFTITIEVTPKVDLVEFMPEVCVEWWEVYNSGTISGSSVSRIADPDDEVGIWTWSTTGSYALEWLAQYMRRVTFSREIVASTPQELKAGIIDKLEQLLAEDIGDDDLLQAIDYTHMSLGDERGRELGSEVIWLDAYHIDRIKGADVFQYEEEAADKLEAYFLNEENASFGFEEAINEVGDNLYNVDRQLAEVAIKDAEAAGGNPDYIAEAKEYVQLAKEQYEAGVKLSAVLDLLEEAWEKAVYSHPPILRLQTWYQPDDSLMTPLQNFVQAVNNNCDSVRVVLYPSSSIVPFGELAEAVKKGTVDMGLIYYGQMSDFSHVVDAGSLPFLYNDDDGWMAAVRGGIGDLLSQELTVHNITVLDWTGIGFSHLYSRIKMLVHPDDVAGLTIRAPGIQAEAINEWSGTSVWVPFAELYQALEGEIVDGAIHTPYEYEVGNFYEVAPYFCVDYAFADLQGLCINSDVWNNLDEGTRQIITQAAGDYVNEMLVTVKQVDAAALERIEGYPGVEVYTLSSEERLVWRQASLPVWEQWLLDVGPVGQQIIDIALEHNPLP